MFTKTEQVWRHIIDGAHHGRRRWDSVSSLAAELGVPVSTTHQALEEPRLIDILRISGGGGLRVVDPGRLLMLWAARRRLDRDMEESIVVPVDAQTAETAFEQRGVVLGGFSAIVARMGFNNIADYSSVLVYGDPVTPRFEDNGRASEIVFLKPDPLLRRYGNVTTLGQAWVDLFRTPGWQAGRFVYDLIPQLLTEDNGVLLQH
jgi:DNA-binding transcriptional regulator YhcF (GntR family)